MPVLLITGTHQSGKSRRLWDLLRARPIGSAALVTPGGVLDRERVREVFAWTGPGLLPPVLALGALWDRLALGAAAPPMSEAVAAHVLRRWCADGGLAGTALEPVAQHRATARALAGAALRCDLARISAADLGRSQAYLHARSDPAADKIPALLRARKRLAQVGAGHGRRLEDLANRLLAPPWPALFFDDLISLAPAELAVLSGLAAGCDLVFTAVDDQRMGAGSLAARLRAAFPGAQEERLSGSHPASGHSPGPRAVLGGMLESYALSATARAAVGRYHYRDEAHGARALATWLRAATIAPGTATVFVRAADRRALALADGLIAAGVPVQGRFQLPFAGTAVGGLVAALGAWCETQDWGRLLAVLERLDLAVGDAAAGPVAEVAVGSADGVGTGTGIAASATKDATKDAADDAAAAAGPLPPTRAPLPPRDLRGPWAEMPAAQALARLESLAPAAETGFARRKKNAPVVADESWVWREPSRDYVWLAGATAWVRAWLTTLAPGAGTWATRLARILARLRLPLPADLSRQLADCDRVSPAAAADLHDLLAATSVEVRRGEDLDPAHCLLLRDAVRDRTRPRPLAILHGLEHGRWPALPAHDALFARDERRSLASALLATDDAADPWDEAGQTAGECAALLAVAARGTAGLLIGIPCGDREPSPLLATFAAQLGWNLVAERAMPGAEAAPGAPLATVDSLSPAESALWLGPVGVPTFRFKVGARAPAALGLSPARLNDLLQDPFAVTLSGLALGPLLSDARAMRDGEDVHALLARLVVYPAERWPTVLPTLADAWIAAAGDAFRQAARRRQLPRILAAITDESRLAYDCLVAAEVAVEIPLTLPDGSILNLRGRVDRLDRFDDGRVRVIDYKAGGIAHYRALMEHHWEAQLAAYVHGLRMAGDEAIGAHYRALNGKGEAAGYVHNDDPAPPKKIGRKGDGKRTAGDAEVDFLVQMHTVVAAISRLAAGEARTDPENSLCQRDGLSAVARLDEARLAPPDDDGPDEDGDGAHDLPVIDRHGDLS